MGLYYCLITCKFILTYYLYLRICGLIYKCHFVYHDVLSGATTWDLKNTSFYRRWISYIYYHPIFITFSIFSIVLIELFIFKGKLYYSLYILFFYPLIFSAFRCFSDFILDVCLCDYINQNFTNHNSGFIYLALISGLDLSINFLMI